MLCVNPQEGKGEAFMESPKQSCRGYMHVFVDVSVEMAP